MTSANLVRKGFQIGLVSASLLAIAACGGGGGNNATNPTAGPTPPPAPPPPPPPPAPTPPIPRVENPVLISIFDAAEERFLALYPLEAQFRGDRRFSRRFGDYVSDQWFEDVRLLAEDNLMQLSRVDRASLSDTDRVAYDVFEYQQRDTLAGYEPAILARNRSRPLNHMTGLHSYYPSIASGNGALPFETLQDYEDNIARNREFAVMLDAVIGEYRDGAAAGLYQPRLVVSKVIAQIDAILGVAPRSSQFYQPVTNFPGTIGSADRNRLAQAYEAMVVDDVYPAYQRLRNYLNSDYLPRARTSVGLSSLPGGDAYYDYIIESRTTRDLSADEVHALGLAQVAGILNEMNAIKDQQGFAGTLDAFEQNLRQQAQYRVTGRTAIVAHYESIGRLVDARLDQLFVRRPTTRLEIRPYDTFTEQFRFAASYQSGSPDGSRPGIFFFNAASGIAFTPPLTSLFLHEGAPGHHFQISLAQENDSLPSFMRFGGPTAYTEGWALYAETLGTEMGLYNDPILRFGHLNQQMLRALRLVVDTGIHARGWSRQRAIDYVVQNSTFSAGGIASEIDRYIAIPGQALSYKIGELAILDLRESARWRLGDRYDIRLFHNEVLNTGALPLPILESKIDGWTPSS